MFQVKSLSPIKQRVATVRTYREALRMSKNIQALGFKAEIKEIK